MKAKAKALREKRQSENEHDRLKREYAERVAREQLTEALERVAREDQMERAWREADASVRLAGAINLKREVLTLLRNSPQPLTFDELIRATGCPDRNFMNTCLMEMVRDGQLLDLGKKAA